MSVFASLFDIVESADLTAQRMTELGAFVKGTGRGRWRVQCPHPDHQDLNPSATLMVGADGKAVLHCFSCADSNTPDWFAAVRTRLTDGVPFQKATPRGSSGSGGQASGVKVAEYEYLSDGGTRCWKARYESEGGGKSFGWSREMGDARPSGLGHLTQEHLLPYRSGELPDDLSVPVLWVEGEKDVDALWALGVPAVTSGGGAHGPLPADLSMLVGRPLVVVPDRDSAGWEYGHRVMEALWMVGCRVAARHPRPTHKGADMSDHLAEGLGLGDLVEESAFGLFTEPQDSPASLRIMGMAHRDIEKGSLSIYEGIGIEDENPTDPEGVPNIPNIEVLSEPWDSVEPLSFASPLPPAALFGPLGEHAEAVARAVEGSTQYVLLSNFAVMSGVTFGNVDVLLSTGHREALSIYTMPVLSPGSRKSSMMSESMRPAREWDLRRQDEWRLLGGDDALDVLRKKLERAKLDAVKTDDPEAFANVQGARLTLTKMEASRPVRIEVPADTTVEALAVEMAANHGTGLVASAEGAFIGNLAGRYSQDGAANLDLVLQAWGHETYAGGRISRQASTITRPHLAVVIGAQPDVLRQMRTDDQMRARGLLQRFLPAVPPDRLGYRSGRGFAVSSVATAAWRDAVVGCADRFASEVPLMMTLDPLVEAAYNGLWRATEEMLRPGGVLGTSGVLREFGGKLPGQILRLAGVYQLAADPRATSIGMDAWSAAESLHGYFVSHARFVNIPGMEPPEHRLLDLLRGLELTAPGIVSTRDLFQRVRGQAWAESTAAVRSALVSLEAHHWIRRVPDGDRGRGRPSEQWQVHPTLIHVPSASDGIDDDSPITTTPKETP